MNDLHQPLPLGQLSVFCIIPYSGKLLREKTFANFVVLWIFAKVSSAKFRGVVSFGAAKASNPRKFFSMKIVFFTNSQKFSPLKVFYYTVHTIQQQNCKYCKYSKHICHVWKAQSFPWKLSTEL